MKYDADTIIPLYSTLDESVTNVLGLLQGYYKSEYDRIHYILHCFENMNKRVLIKQLEEFQSHSTSEEEAMSQFYQWVLGILDGCGPRPAVCAEPVYHRRAS